MVEQVIPDAGKLVELGNDLRDMFIERWGFGPPPPAYAALYRRDLEVIRWADGISARASSDTAKSEGKV